MAIKELNKIDENLSKIYESQVTTNIQNEDFTDRSDVLFNQMKFIAMYNKNFLNIK